MNINQVSPTAYATPDSRKGTIEEGMIRRQRLASEMGIDFSVFKWLNFIVTDHGTPMIVHSERNITEPYLKRQGIHVAARYSSWLVRMPCTFKTWNGFDHDVFSEYLTDADTERSPEQVIRKVINEAGKITFI